MSRADLIAEIKATASRHDEAACTLLAVHSFAAAAEQVCLAIEAMAGYFVGSRARGVSKASFVRFAQRYLPDLGAAVPGIALAGRADEPLGSAAEAVYLALRGGLFHEGGLAGGIEVVDDKRRWMLSFEADGSARGLKAFLRALKRDGALAAKAERRSAFLARAFLR